MDLKNKVKSLPSQSGVYFFKDENDKTIYTGKAKNLKKRVSSYFSKKSSDIKTSYLIRNIRDVSYIVTDTEKEAFLLEDSYIKKLKPKFNVRLRDDKRYPYLKVTLTEDFPRLVLSRRISSLKDKYFGPFPSNKTVSRLIQLLTAAFRLRKCKKFKMQKRECLYYHIKQCPGPCTGKISRDEYLEVISKVIKVLEGGTDNIIKELEEQMKKAASDLKYETAGELRDRISALKELSDYQKIYGTNYDNFDALAASVKNNFACIMKFMYRNGKLTGNEYHFAVIPSNETIERLISFYIMENYYRSIFIPNEIICEIEFEDVKLIEEWLTEKRKSKVKITIPVKGKKKGYIDLTKKNSEMMLNQEILRIDRNKERIEGLQKLLKLEKRPVLIEAFDISNISGKYAVGSMVVCRNGVMSKKEYRKFKIKSVKKIDDYSMMKEVISRRYRNRSGDDLPDLILIDGGQGHLNAGIEIMNKYNLKVPVISIAKKEEIIYSSELPKSPIRLNKNSKILQFIQEIRDESHRFAINYHKLLRNKDIKLSVIDSIEGIGDKKKMEILKEFKSVENLKYANIKDILKIKGIGKKLAGQIKKKVNDS